MRGVLGKEFLSKLWVTGFDHVDGNEFEGPGLRSSHHSCTQYRGLKMCVLVPCDASDNMGHHHTVFSSFQDHTLQYWGGAVGIRCWELGPRR